MRLLRFFRNFYNIYLAVVLVLLLVVAPFSGHTFKRYFNLYNSIYFIVAITLCILIIWFICWLKKKKSKILSVINKNSKFNIIVIIGSILLLAVQLFVVFGAWFIVGWDVRNVTDLNLQVDQDYMSMYPNQLFLAGLFRRIHTFIATFGITEYKDYYLVLVLMSTFAVFVSVILLTYISKKLTNNLCAFCTFLLSSVFTGLSPWIMVPYSDNFAMLCIVAAFFSYVCIKNRPLKSFLISAIALLGYAIKPTALFVLLAIAFVEAVRLLATQIYNKKKLKLDNQGYVKNYKTTKLEKFCIKIIDSIRKLTKTKKPASSIYSCDKKLKNNTDKPRKKISKQKNLIIFIVSVICASCGLVLSDFLIAETQNYDIEINENRSFTPTHFMMMGLNWETKGGWNNNDVTFSRSYDNVEDREEANIEETFNRIVHNGPIGVLIVYISKTMTNYGDSTFAWEAEVPWCMDNCGHNDLVWTFYGIDPWYMHDDINNNFHIPWQIMWFIIISGSILMIFCQRPKKHEVVLCCSMLAISAFLMIFEPDPRYLMLYTPFLVLMAPWGWYRTYKVLNCSSAPIVAKLKNYLLKTKSD